MTALGQQYVSDYGWVISLPPRWELLPGSGAGLILQQPVVFASSDDWSLSLTWMVAAGPVSQNVIQNLVTLTMLAGPVNPDEARAVVQSVFPVIGQVDEAEVVELADESPALEILETFQSGQETKRGYQLIMPLQTAPGQASTLQRLCFYAPIKSFSQVIADVRQAARSFHYVRLFGAESAESE